MITEKAERLFEVMEHTIGYFEAIDALEDFLADGNETATKIRTFAEKFIFDRVMDQAKIVTDLNPLDPDAVERANRDFNAKAHATAMFCLAFQSVMTLWDEVCELSESPELAAYAVVGINGLVQR